MRSVVSLWPDPDRAPAAALLVERVAGQLALRPRHGADGSWELCFECAYAAAHTRVVDALDRVDAEWPQLVTLDYALAV